MRDFKQLQIWRLSHQLTLDVYALTSSFPKEEAFGLTSQLRRAVASVPTNVAEGGQIQRHGHGTFHTNSNWFFV